MAFEHVFVDWDYGMDLPKSLNSVALETLGEISVVATLPESNRNAINAMATYMIYDMYGQSWYSGRTLDSFWGLYIVGSRAREEARDDSDLDVLSVGNIGRSALEMRDGWSLGVQLKDPLRQVYGREEYFNDEPSTDDERLAEYFRPFFYRGERTDVSLRRIAPDKPSMGTRIGIDLMVQANPLAVDFDADKFRELDVDEDDLPLPKIPLIELAIPSHKKRKELLS